MLRIRICSDNLNVDKKINRVVKVYKIPTLHRAVGEGAGNFLGA